MIGSLLASGPAGIPVSPPVVAYNLVAFVLFGAGTLLLAFRRIPLRWAHATMTLLWWGPVGGTLLSEHFSGSIQLTLVLLLEIAGSAILLHTSWTVASFLVVAALWVPMAIRDGGADAAVYVATVLAAMLFATLWQVLMRRSLVQAETLRRAEAKAAGKVA